MGVGLFFPLHLRTELCRVVAHLNNTDVYKFTIVSTRKMRIPAVDGREQKVGGKFDSVDLRSRALN